MHGFTKCGEPPALQDWKRKKCHDERQLLSEVGWDELDSEVKAGLQAALLECQGALCAYCGARIARDSMRIEHWVAQSEDPSKRFDWDNLLGVCNGHDGVEAHCDRARGDKPLTCKPDRDKVDDHFDYYSRGRETFIRATGSGAASDDIRTLNLNAARLRRNRREVLVGLETVFARRYSNRPVPRSVLKKLLTWTPELVPYFQVVRPYLERLLRKAP